MNLYLYFFLLGTNIFFHTEDAEQMAVLAKTAKEKAEAEAVIKAAAAKEQEEAA